MFGKAFFLRHQGKLLWLLNAPVVRKWFRYVLRIHGEGSSVGDGGIWGILPNAIFWYSADDLKAEFRTHAKFSKRLYYAFRPLWWALHAWDWCVADRWVPELSFGFSTLTVYPDAGSPGTTTVDGWTWHNYGEGAGQVWATMRVAAGTSVDNITTVGWNFSTDSDSGNWKEVDRGIILFDSRALTSGATISATVLSLYGESKGDSLSVGTPDSDIFTSNPASNTSLTGTDFATVGTTSQTGSAIAYASISTAAYNNFTFNATGRGNVSKTGISKFAVANSFHDRLGNTPNWETTNSTVVSFFSADQTGTANDPKLVVTYTVSYSDQEGFRFRNDDGNETTASWKANQDAQVTAATGTPFRVRFLVNATGDPASTAYQLEYRRSTSSNWKKVM